MQIEHKETIMEIFSLSSERLAYCLQLIRVHTTDDSFYHFRKSLFSKTGVKIRRVHKKTTQFTLFVVLVLVELVCPILNWTLFFY